MATAFKLKRSSSSTQPYYFTVISPGNGATLATSETYASKANALNGMQAIINAMQGSVQYDDET
ncbi:YegP family protein [Microbacterium aquilitoris]|uniref:YegP family protein n=1 Tax=Microbacterium aquilitoris TaxID=3067307 RepID=UPI00288F1E6B|nr:YegP family protein [Microbacterium sp. KSW2-22]MDT3343879.1 YegP family protein [Microbacterium sp. KSW2-22]